MGKELAVILNHNGVEIVADPDNLTSLTALWRAAGSEHSKRPNEWLRSQSAREFIASLASNLGVDPKSLVRTKRGRTGSGVWSAEEVAFRYKAWLDARHPRSASSPSVYFIECGTTRRIKIGTAVDVARRFAVIQAMCPTKLTLRATIRGGVDVEGRLHSRFAEYRIRGEWFRPGPRLIAFLESETAAVIQERAADGNTECLEAVRVACRGVKAAIQTMSARSA